MLCEQHPEMQSHRFILSSSLRQFRLRKQAKCGVQHSSPALVGRKSGPPENRNDDFRIVCAADFSNHCSRLTAIAPRTYRRFPAGTNNDFIDEIRKRQPKKHRELSVRKNKNPPSGGFFFILRQRQLSQPVCAGRQEYRRFPCRSFPAHVLCQMQTHDAIQQAWSDLQMQVQD